MHLVLPHMVYKVKMVNKVHQERVYSSVNTRFLVNLIILVNIASLPAKLHLECAWDRS